MTAFSVRVPCSTSNLGSGFDCLGVALGKFELIVRVRPGGEGLRIVSLRGEGTERLSTDATNLICVAAEQVLKAAQRSARDLAATLEVENSIPLARGLGSSAAAAVAGTLIADRLLDLRLSLMELLTHATALEGHADNVAPALLGGAQVAVVSGKGVVADVIQINKPLSAVIFVPDKELLTSQARNLLPEVVPFRDAVFNVGRAALTVAALQTGRYELLAESMEDKLHQHARSNLMPWLPLLITRAKIAGAYGAALSGAGTSVCAFCEPNLNSFVRAAMEKVAKEMVLVGTAHVVDVGVAGARVESEP